MSPRPGGPRRTGQRARAGAQRRPPEVTRCRGPRRRGPGHSRRSGSPGCGPGRSTKAVRRCPRRGAAWCRAARCWWTGATPFGLAHRTLDTGEATELYVRPRAVDLPEVSASLARSVDGPQADTTMEGTLAFHALREYVPGDEPASHALAGHGPHREARRQAARGHRARGAGRGARRAWRRRAEAGAAEAFEVAVDCAAAWRPSRPAQRHPVMLVDTCGGSLLPGAVRQYGSYTVDDVLDSLTRVVPADVPDGAPPATLRRLAAGGRGSLAVVDQHPPAGLAGRPAAVTGGLLRPGARRARARRGRACGQRARTGRVLWTGVRQAEDLAAAFIRARAAA